MTERTITVEQNGVAIIPLTVAKEADLHCGVNAVLIVWDDDDESISSVRAEMQLALRIQAERAHSPTWKPPDPPPKSGPTPEDAPSSPTRPPGVSLYTRRERGG